MARRLLRVGSGSANQVALGPTKLQKNEDIKPTKHCAAQQFGRYLGENPRFLSSIFFVCARVARARVRVP